MLCARHWASGCWLNAWTHVSGLMAITWCTAYGHAMLVVLSMVWAQAAFPPRRKREYASGEWTEVEKRRSHHLD